MTPLLFLDTETTSLRHDRRAWNIGMIRREEDGEYELEIIVEDVDLSGADPQSLMIGHFYERHPLALHEHLDAPNLTYLDERHAAIEVEHWSRGAHIVGAVPNFDTEVLRATLRRHRLCWDGHYHLIDVENLAVGYLHGLTVPDTHLQQRYRELATPPYDSRALSEALGVEMPPPEERHTALGDARWCKRLYDSITSHHDG